MSKPPSENRLKVTLVVPSFTAGGVGTVARYAANGLARCSSWQVTLLSLHDEPVRSWVEPSGLIVESLALHDDFSRRFLAWLSGNSQDVIVSSDVMLIEPAFPYLPTATCHIIQIHDSLRRYRAVAVHNSQWIDGVACVAQHIEQKLRSPLRNRDYRGLLATIHNGAEFPPVQNRSKAAGPLRLLFLGRLDAYKGVFDVIPILKRLRRRGVEVTLELVGDDDARVGAVLAENGFESFATVRGPVSHAECYQIAARSDVLLMFARKEPFGMVTIEAMSMGCVPIAYDVPSGSTEIIEDGVNGILVGLGDYDAVAAAIESLDSHRDRLEHMARAAMIRAREHFNAALMSSKMMDFIADVRRSADLSPSLRYSGLPPRQHAKPMRSGWRQQFLPDGLRRWLRRFVCNHPRLCYWIINR